MPKTPSPKTGSDLEAAHAAEYTVDELARVADTTVRNVRAYQDRGLLAPPEKRGRVGIYDDTHVSRLKLINHLLARAYTLGNIEDLIKAVDGGHDLRSILGLENAIGSRWSKERPKRYAVIELARLFGAGAGPRAVGQAVELGLLERDGLGFVATSPATLEAGASMAKAGVPIDDLLDAIAAVRPHFDAIAQTLVDLVVRRLDRYGADTLPPAADVPDLADTIWRLRPLAMVLVESEMKRALEEKSGDFLGDRVATVMEKMRLDEQSATTEPAPATSARTRRKR